MLQVALSGGEVRVVEVPEPVVRPGTVRVRTSHSLISAGTESAGIGSGGRPESLVIRAIKNPALVKKVVERVASHGFKQTAELVRTRISTDAPSGHSSAVVVTEVGEGIEKPMTMTVADARAREAVARKGTLLTVGCNRRFSPHSARLKQLPGPIAATKPLANRVNAGALPPEHWLLDPKEGGGRPLGEGVHFFDMLRFLAGAEPVRVQASSRYMARERSKWVPRPAAGRARWARRSPK